MSLVIDNLPVPPSTNNLFATVRNKATGRTCRIVTDDYAGWRLVAGVMIATAGDPVHGRVSVVVDVFGGKGYPVNRDLDNTFKAILDALVAAGKIDGDDVRTVRSLGIAYHSPVEPKAKAHVRVSVYSQEATHV